MMALFRDFRSYLFRTLCDHLPISRRKIVFCNFDGRGWGENPKYIAEEIIRQKLPYKLVWLSNSHTGFPNAIKVVSWGSHRAIIELSSARIIINNVKTGLPFKKKKNQYYIQTWHSDFGIKLIEKEVESQLDPYYVSTSKKDSAMTDLIIAGSKFMANVYKTSFWYSGEILESGLPRNDLFFTATSETIKHEKETLGLKPNIRILLYAPTFRENHSGYRKPHLRHIADALNSSEEMWMIILRHHPNEADIDIPCNHPFIKDFSSFPDPQIIELVSDILLTDYSSMMHDFALMKKPVIMYTPDLETYKQQRGIRPVFDKLPFITCKTTDDIIYTINNFPYQTYRKNLDSFLEEYVGSFDQGTASKTVVNRIKEIIQ